MKGTLALEAIRELFAALSAPRSGVAHRPLWVRAEESASVAPGSVRAASDPVDAANVPAPEVRERRTPLLVDGETARARQAAEATGSELDAGSLLSCAASQLPAPELWDVVETCQQVMNVAAACQAVAMAHAAAQEFSFAEDGTDVWSYRGVGHDAEDSSDLAAGRLGVSEHVAGRRIDDAIDQVLRTPTLIAAMAAGEVNVFTASVVTDELRDASPQVAGAVVDDLHASGALVRETPGPLRQRARRLLGRLDPDVLAARAASERARRGLARSFESACTDRWVGIVPTEASRPAWAAIEVVAEQIMSEGGCESISRPERTR